MGKSKSSLGGYGVYLGKIKSLYQKKEVQLYTNLILSFGAVICFALFAIKPTLTTIAKVYKEYRDQKEVDLRLQEKIDNLRKAKEAYQQIEEKLHLIQEALPTQPEAELLVAQLEQLAARNNCVLEEVSFGNVMIKGEINLKEGKNKDQPAEKPDQPTLEGNLQIVGTYRDVLSFLGDLYDLRRLNTVSHLSLEGSARQPLEARLNLTAYYLPSEL